MRPEILQNNAKRYVSLYYMLPEGQNMVLHPETAHDQELYASHEKGHGNGAGGKRFLGMHSSKKPNPLV